MKLTQGAFTLFCFHQTFAEQVYVQEAKVHPGGKGEGHVRGGYVHKVGFGQKRM